VAPRHDVSVGRRGDIQGLRAVAILMVVAFHGGFGLAGGFTGVDVFFVISGFVITSTLVREIARDGSISLPGFYLRRVKRLLPALAVVVTFVAGAGVLFVPISALRTSALTGVAATFFGANYYLDSLPNGYFAISSSLNPLLHTWTLAVEEQFYLIFPVVLLSTWRLGRRAGATGRINGGAIVAIGSLTVLSFFAAEHWSRSGVLAFYAAPARAWEFGAGALVALLGRLWRQLPSLLWSAVAAVGIAAIALGALAPPGPSVSPASLLIPVAGACLLLMAGTSGGLISEALASRPMVVIGDRSYSWYLWHWPLIVFAVALFPGSSWAARSAALISVVPAWASYRYVENPIRFNPRVRGHRALALIAVCLVIPVAVSLAQARFPLKTAAAYVGGLHEDFTRGCDGPAPLGAPSRSGCTWPAVGARGTVVLIGDSNAGHFTEPVVAAARHAHLNTIVATYSACPFVRLSLSAPGRDDGLCTRFDRLSLRWLARARPTLVIVGTRADPWIEDPHYGLAPANTRSFSHTAPTKEVLWAAGLRSEIQLLDRAGVPVIVVHPVPMIALDDGACAVIDVLVDRCHGSIQRKRVDRQLRRTLVAEGSAVRGFKTASILDLESEICTPTTCSTSHDGVVMYRDSGHLSVHGALTLTPAFFAAIAGHARRPSAPARPRSRPVGENGDGQA
jgi:peptidoglycan/LPS O-acetylase OafA/YrhL